MRYLSVRLLAGCLSLSGSLHSQGISGFAGTWRQDISRTSPRPKGKIPKELKVKIDGNTLTMNMAGPGKVPSVDVTFQIGGPEVTYIGLDGDEFHVRVTRNGGGLVFDGREHESGSDYPVHEVWVLRNKGNGQVLVDTKNAKNAKDPDDSAKAVTEYERVEE